MWGEVYCGTGPATRFVSWCKTVAILQRGIVMAALAFEREMEFAHGTADQVSPLIRRIVCNNPGPFTFTGTGSTRQWEIKVSQIPCAANYA